MPKRLRPPHEELILVLITVIIFLIALITLQAVVNGDEVVHIPPHVQVYNEVMESANLVLIPASLVGRLNSSTSYLSKWGKPLVKWGNIDSQLPPLAEDYFDSRFFKELDFDKIK